MKIIESDWRQIPNWTQYQAHPSGMIRRSKDSKRIGNVIPGRELKQNCKKSGYCAVQLNENGKERTCLVHRLIAETFHADRNPARTYVNHIDGDKSNNRTVNLEWVTPQENYLHAIKTGLAPLGDRNGSRTKPESRPRGERSAASKLTEEKVSTIKKLRAQGATLSSIAGSVGVCFQSIHNVVTGKTWRHVI